MPYDTDNLSGVKTKTINTKSFFTNSFMPVTPILDMYKVDAKLK